MNPDFPYDFLQSQLRAAAEERVLLGTSSWDGKRRTYIYVNNRLEGNATRTIAAVLAMAAESPAC